MSLCDTEREETSSMAGTADSAPHYGELVSVARAAAHYSVSKLTIYRWVRLGHIQYERHARTIRVFLGPVRKRATTRARQRAKRAKR